MLLFDKDVSGGNKFNLVWCGLWFILCAYFAVAYHDGWQLVMMLIFGLGFAWGIHLARQEKKNAETVRNLIAGWEEKK